MTITNHIRRIEELSGHVLVFVDAREYEQAHCALDDIEKEVRLSHEHIDNLQLVKTRVLASAGES